LEFYSEGALSLNYLHRVGSIAVVVIVIVIIIVASVLVYQYMAPSSPSSSASPPSPSTGSNKVTINVFAGEMNTSVYGFGNSSGAITSPGPSYTVKQGSTVTIKLTNAGSMAHNWALVTEKSDAVNQLVFPDAHIGDGLTPVAPGESATCTFVADKTGTYYYICQVDGHVTLGMWGYFTVIT
jgi:uncharacterized cupredoxin-like copper-binding protein